MQARFHNAQAAIARWVQTSRVVIGVAVVALVLFFVATNTYADDAANLKEYQAKFQELPADDLQGHVKLALWCRDKEAWDLLTRQCNHVLSLDRDHKLAKLLLDLAKSKRGESVASGSSGSGSDAGSSSSSGSGFTGSRSGDSHAKVVTDLLTKDQVQKLRRMELRLSIPEKVRVDLKNDVDDRFLELMTIREQLSRQDQIAFRKFPPVRKAQIMLGKIEEYERAATATEDAKFNDEYSEDIIIESDPMIFEEFKKGVWPVIESGCATSGCHSGPQASAPVLYNERRLSDEMLYTNYLILHEYEVGDKRVINRDFPQDSLLLVYGIPVAGNQSTEHPKGIKPIYSSPNDRKYVTVGRWISALGVPAPDYGIEIKGVK